MDSSSSSKKFKIKDSWSLLVDTYKEWNSNNPFRLSAVVAYYAVLALPALVVIIINTVGYIWGQEIVQGKLHDEFSSILGEEAAFSIEDFISETQSENKSLISTIIGIGTLLFGATGVFYQLQLSLNIIWKLKQSEDAGIWKIAIDRVRGFGFVLVIGFLLLISFILTAALSVLSDYIKSSFPDFMLYLATGIDAIISIAIIAILFALMFKYLPDAKVKWKTVWKGALLTSLLFSLGKLLLGYYFGEVEPGSTYGAAGSIVLILLWVSYSCLILFFGAQFTYVYAKRYGHEILPNENSVRYEQKVITKD